VATCNPECATMSLTAEVVEPAMQALASVSVSPGSVPCGPFKTPFTVTVNVSADAAPSTFTVRVEGKIIDGGEVACETTSQATVTIDECVDLNFVDAVPDDLEADPGGFLCVNDDDDNDSDVADKDEPGPTVGENDLRPLTISMSGGWTGEGMVTLSCEAGCGRVRFYENANRTNPVTLPLMWDVPTPDLPKTLYVEGFAASSTPRDVELKALFAGEDGPCEDHVKLTVIRVDLDADSDNNGLIEQSDDPIENDSPGKFLAVNDDDDDLDTLQDANDSGPIVGENDLIPIVLDADFVPPDPSTATWTLSWTPASRIQVWETADKSGQMFANGTALAWPISTSQLFVEGLQPGAVTVTLRVQSPEFPDGCEDVARLTVVRIQLFRDEAATLTLDDWPQNPVSGLPRSPKHLFAKEDNIFGRVTTEPGFGNGYFSFVVASQSDTNGISIKLDEITPGVHQNTTASGEVLRLADVTGSGATDTLKVVDEEILTFELNLWPKKQPLLITKDVMVDRAEATGGGINVFYGSATGDRNVLNQRLWGDAKWWQSGDFDAGNTSGTDLLTLRSLIKNAGSNAAASLEGDFMLISTHGAQDGNLYNDSGAVIFDPNGGGSVGISSGNSANCAASVGNGVFRRAG